MDFVRQNTNSLTGVILLITLLSAIDNTDARVKNCAECAPRSVCQIVTQDGISMTTCLCPQGWLGEACKERVWLSLVEVSMDTVSLQVHVDDALYSTKVVSYKNLKSDLAINSHDMYLLNDHSNFTHGAHNYILSSGSDMKSQELASTMDNMESNNRQFSLHYWVKDNSEKCNIIADLSTDLIKVFSLQYDSSYIFCIYTTRKDLCAPRPFILTDSTVSESNCIFVTTGPDPNEKSFMYSIVLGIVCGVCLVILVILTVVFIRKHGLSQLTFCLSIRRPRRKTHKTVMSDIQMGKLEYGDQLTDGDLSFDTEQSVCLLNSSENQRVTIHPPKQPGKPKHQLVKQRAHGYAAFSAKNELTIPLSAVVEYEEETCNNDEASCESEGTDDNVDGSGDCDDVPVNRDDVESLGNDLNFTDEGNRSLGSFHSFKATDS